MDNKLNELSKPVAWLAIYHGDVYDEAISITRPLLRPKRSVSGWESALTEITPLYSQEYVPPCWRASKNLNGESLTLRN